MSGIYLVVFIINLLLGMTMPILPLIIVDISGMVASAGILMTVFMVALFLVRLFLLYYHPSLITMMRWSLLAIWLGYALLVPFSDKPLFYYLAALLWGIGIGIEAPAMITIMGKVLKDATRGVRDHNIFFALGSCFGPLLGYFLYQGYAPKTLFYWMTLFAALAFVAGLLSLKKEMVSEHLPESHQLNLLFRQPTFRQDLLSYFVICLCYGCIVAYAPLLLEGKNIRVDLYFVIFWISFILAQLFTVKLLRNQTERWILTLLFLGTSSALFLLAFVSHYFIAILSAMGFGACYGGAMLYFYRRTVEGTEDHTRKSAIALLGILAYVGIGAGALLFSPLAEYSIELTFLLTPLIPIIFLLKKLVFL